ncbi:MAG: 3-dehydroquinate synthase [Pseudomonadota bacterium]
MSSITVDLGDRSYPIYIKAGIFQNTGFSFSEVRHSNAVILTNTTVGPIYLDNIVEKLEQQGKSVSVVTIDDGEQYKQLQTFEFIMGELLQKPMGRDTVLVALGGGVVGDIGGFVSACYQRGIDFVQVPTTLLSQVDSSVGGKTAVNHALGKNMIGAFYQPKAVYIDTETLNTLPDNEFSAGMAEVIKYGIIYDAPFFDWLAENKAQIRKKSPTHIAHMVRRCCEIKAEIVKQDETEKGLRALLNLGHTFGHAIESEQGYGVWLHGEAVSAGMIFASILSNMRGGISLTELDDIKGLLTFFNLPIHGPEEMKVEQYHKHMKRDKKVENGKMRFIIPTKIGHAEIVNDVTNTELQAVLG